MTAGSMSGSALWLHWKSSVSAIDSAIAKMAQKFEKMIAKGKK